MAIFEQDKVLYEEASNGDKTIILPVTRANNVEGLGRSANTKFVAGEVVYVDNNKKIALKCIVGGTTSANELDVSSKAIGETVVDGSVTWQVCGRTSDVTSVNGKTGDVVVGKVTDLSISGKTITVTFADGTDKKLTTQDTIVNTSTLGAVSLHSQQTIQAEVSGKTYSITGLTPLKPVYFCAQNTSGNYAVSLGVISGVALNSSWESDFNITKQSGRTCWGVVIPTGTSITLKASNNTDTSGRTTSVELVVYQ